MKITELENGKIKCDHFTVKDDLSLEFNELDDAIYFFNNAFEKINKYKQDKIGDEKIFKVYLLLELDDNQENHTFINQLNTEKWTNGELGQALDYITNKRKENIK
jgi:hypothetical protein